MKYKVRINPSILASIGFIVSIFLPWILIGYVEMWSGVDCIVTLFLAINDIISGWRVLVPVTIMLIVQILNLVKLYQEIFRKRDINKINFFIGILSMISSVVFIIDGFQLRMHIPVNIELKLYAMSGALLNFICGLIILVIWFIRRKINRVEYK